MRPERVLTLLYHDVYGSDPKESGFEGTAARRYKLPRTEFERQLDSLAAVAAAVPLTDMEAAGSAAARDFAITVDDGGVSYHTIIAGCLEGKGWRGHCFVTTGWIGRPGFMDAPQLRELHGRGHVIGSHSVTHPGRFAACSWDEMLREWSDSRKALEDILGAGVTSASVPGGYFSRRVAHAARVAGFKTLFTSEPETRVRAVGDCRVYGRHTLRHGGSTELPARLLRGETLPLCREWLSWNGKKALKAMLGAGYLQLSARLGRGAG